MKEVSFKFW